MFKRREKRSSLETLQNIVYPRGGWGRAVSYISHRLQRLPDPPAKIARGIAAGVFASFTPLFGLHFIAAGLFALVIRGNLLAALLSTFVGNPLTFPFIAAISIKTGERILHVDSPVPLSQVFQAFSRASTQLWHNVTSLVTSDVAHWNLLDVFFRGVFLPYLVGGIIPGLLAATLAYLISRPIMAAYQKRRAGKTRLKAKLHAKPDQPLRSD
ncbi:DUF2062 domain-containing protein [Pseudoruegeria sp. SK021]|uniref:DUF2062 domain-containing protein n=1 Tax=Pseudoruegeria sp. SK021 TaxID=1933035 RepID=UPI001F0AA756|nr:DUF2062 domain-containing protein [Pseudoruegeria sp. SK021]